MKYQRLLETEQMLYTIYCYITNAIIYMCVCVCVCACVCVCVCVFVCILCIMVVIQVKPECSIWRVIYTMVWVR